jgi:hypothetical protein
MASMTDASATGTRDETYDIVSVLYHALQGAENCQTYCQDAGGDQELRRFFEEAQNQQRQIADRAKQMLGHRLVGPSGGGGAFGFGQSGSQGSTGQDTSA